MSSMTWRPLLLAAIPVAVLVAFFTAPPIPQALEYHLFADRRGCLGIPNFGDVASNLAFLIAGAVGLHCCIAHRWDGARLAWSTFFAGAMLVSIGSAYYHWEPNNQTLVWDRLPMTIGFMGAYVALLAEYAGRQLERVLILPAMALGLASVVYWGFADDLRLYFALQGTVFATILVLIVAFEHPPRQRGYLVLGFSLYALAVVAERLDRDIFGLLGGSVSGHTLKHLLAASAVLVIALMLRARAALPATAGEAKTAGRTMPGTAAVGPRAERD